MAWRSRPRRRRPGRRPGGAGPARRRCAPMTAAAAAPAAATGPMVSRPIPPMATTGAGSPPATSASMASPRGGSAMRLVEVAKTGPKPTWSAPAASAARPSARVRVERPTSRSGPTTRPRRRHRQVLVADVDAVGAGEHRQVGPVVDDHQGPAAGQRHQPRRPPSSSPSGSPLHAQLKDGGPAVERQGGLGHRIRGAHDGVEPGQPVEPGGARGRGGQRHRLGGTTRLDGPARRRIWSAPLWVFPGVLRGSRTWQRRSRSS